MRGAWTAWQPRLAASPCPCRCVRVLLTQACAIQRKCASLHTTCLPHLSAHGRSQLCEVQVFALLPRHQVATDPKPTSPDQSGRLFQGLDSCRSQSHVALVWRGRQLSPKVSLQAREQNTSPQPPPTIASPECKAQQPQRTELRTFPARRTRPPPLHATSRHGQYAPHGKAGARDNSHAPRPQPLQPSATQTALHTARQRASTLQHNSTLLASLLKHAASVAQYTSVHIGKTVHEMAREA